MKELNLMEAEIWLVKIKITQGPLKQEKETIFGYGLK